MNYFDRTYIDDVFFEIANHDENKPCIVFCPGLPSTMKQRPSLLKLANEGFHVLYPRYPGTYESHGLFLDSNPASTIRNKLNLLQREPYKEHYGQQHKQLNVSEFIIMGSSFGGLVASNLANNDDLFVGLSPLTKRTEALQEDLEELKPFLQESYQHVYRISEDGFDAFLKKERFDDPNDVEAEQGLVFQSKNDPTIPWQVTKQYCQRHSFTLKNVEGSHVGLTDLNIKKLSNTIKRHLSETSQHTNQS